MSLYPPSPATLRSPADLAAGSGPANHPNPEYADLYAAYARAYAGAPALETALDPPLRTAGDAWAGAAARGWERELEAQRALLKKATAQILWDIYDALSKVPPYLPK